MKTMIEKIQNWTDLVSALADRILQADIDCNQYQTDIYLYVHEDGSWELEDFVNVGGNSWLQDNHITVWCDKEHLENWMDWMDWMTAEAKEDSGMQEMLEDLKAAYVESLKDSYADYLKRAEAALLDAVEVSENE